MTQEERNRKMKVLSSILMVEILIVALIILIVIIG